MIMDLNFAVQQSSASCFSTPMHAQSVIHQKQLIQLENIASYYFTSGVLSGKGDAGIPEEMKHVKGTTRGAFCAGEVFVQIAASESAIDLRPQHAQ
jgi:hypothetical protein